MSCRVLGGPDFGSSLKGMGLLYRNLWGSGLSRKRVRFFGLALQSTKKMNREFFVLSPASNFSEAGTD